MFFIFFFRDPERHPPEDEGVIVAGADGIVTEITNITYSALIELCKHSGLSDEAIKKLDKLVEQNSVRISIFLSPFDVHVNRAPIGGQSEFLGYFPGKRHFTFLSRSSGENQHNAILIKNFRTCCLIRQIAGPVCRRVVYWHSKDRPVFLKMGERIGMMKFGSRLDMYFPERDIIVNVHQKDRVRAGETIIAKIRGEHDIQTAGTN
jgi:phosphatidylserine decarboxylase